MKTILVIDDDAEFRGVLVQLLQGQGWNVLEAPDGETGLAMARRSRPAAVLTDLLMPRLNGFQVCAQVRQEPALRRCLLIAMSGKGYSDNRLNALAAGADEFLVKPFSFDELIALLNRVGPATPAEAVVASALPSQAVTFKFWGVRGSVPTPGPSTVHYGGNTSCVEVRADGEIIVLDSGTGIRPLGLALKEEFKDRPLQLTVLISHTHWDHVQGFPFFQPAYAEENRIRILGYEGARDGLVVFSNQMESPFFPIGLSSLPSQVTIEEMRDMEFDVGQVRVRAEFMNHPGVCVGYRLHTSQGVITYMPDNEPFFNAIEPPADRAQAFEHVETRKLLSFLRDSDALIIDAQYDCAEYANHVGWGHGCVDDVVELAVRGDVKQLFLFHHDPTHDDAKVASMLEHARSLARKLGSIIRVEAAREGEQFQLQAQR